MNHGQEYMYPEGNAPYINPYASWGGNMESMTDPEEVILSLEANFKGQVQLASGKWVTRFSQRMNERGINEIVGMVRSVVNRISFMSNVNDQVLYGILEGFASTLAVVLMMNRSAFNIQSDADRSSVFWQCMTVSHLAILRGYKEGEKRFWKGSQADISFGNVSSQEQPGIVPSGGLSKFSPKNWMK